MLLSFRSKELAKLWEGTRTKIDVKFHSRILRRLDALSVAESVDEMNLPGFNFHTLRGFHPTRYSIHVNGPWCITFSFVSGGVIDVDFEQYH